MADFGLRNENVAGVDVHKEKLTITVLFNKEGNAKKETWECGTFSNQLEEAAKKIKSFNVIEVAMESTGIYWRPIYNIWSKLGLVITLGNAHHLKNVPGRKTDIKDSEWIAQLHQAGLIRPSYIPDQTFRELRGLTRHRTTIVNEISRLKNRVQKILEDGNIKLGSVLSDVFGVAGKLILVEIIKGEKDPEKLANLVTTNIRANKEELIQSLTHHFEDFQIYILGQLYRQYLVHMTFLDEISAEILLKMEPFTSEIDKLDKIPGVSKTSAFVIIAEATTKMDQFKDEKSFAAWAGVAPGNNESAGKKKEQNVSGEILL